LVSSFIVAFILLIVLVTQLLVLRKISGLADSNIEQIKLELVKLLEQNELSLRDGFNESRRELREVSAENRREIYELFKDFQDTLLKRVVENSSAQNRQLEVFKNSLNSLSDYLVKNSNEFKQNVST